MFYSRRPLSLFCLSLIAATNLVWADDSEPGNAIMEQTTVIASRLPQSVDQLGASLSLIDAEALGRVGHIHISEILTRAPGTWISRGNGQEHLTAIRSPVLTGAGGCGSFYMALDGIPLRASGFCNVNQLADVNSEQAARIEVLRGPGTAIHGANALHGVINVLSKPAVVATEQMMGLEVGPHDYGRVRYSGSTGRGEHAVRLSMLAAQDGGYKDDSGFDQQKLTLRHDYSGSRLQLTNLLEVTNLQQETATYIEGADAYKDSGRKRDNPNPEAFRDSRLVRAYSRASGTLANGDSWQLTPYLRLADMRFLMHFLPQQPLEENGEKSLGLQSSYSTERFADWLLTTGIDLEWTDGFLKQRQDNPTSSVFPAGKQYDYEVEAQLLAAYVDSEYVLTDRIRVRGGLRLEQQRYDYDNRFTVGRLAEDGSVCVNTFTGETGCRYTRPADRSDRFRDWSGNLGLYHQLSDRTSSFLRLARGFRPPQASELYRLQNGQLTTAIDSVQADSVEWGLNQRSDNWQWQVVLFWMEKDNIIFQGADRLNLDNGATDHIGMEYSLSWNFHPDWRWQLNGTLARHRYSKNVTEPGGDIGVSVKGNDVDTAPRHLASSQLLWQVLPATQLELEWVHMGDYYTDIYNRFDYSGHDLLNLRWQQQLSADLALTVRLTNLTDRDYAERADYTVFGGERYFVGEPRSLYLALNWQWH